MNDLSNTDFLRLSGWKSISVEETEFDFHVRAEITDEMTECPMCSSLKITKHDKRLQVIMDQPNSDKRVGIHLDRQRYRCDGKKNHIFSAYLPGCDGNRSATTRLIEKIKKDCLHNPFTKIADYVGMDESTIRDIFSEWVTQKDASYAPVTPEILGIDELHIKTFRCVLTNIGSSTVVDMLPTREKDDIEKRLTRMDTSKINIVAMDMWIPFREAIERIVPKALIVIDKFHVLKSASRCMDKERISIQRANEEFRKKLKNEKSLFHKKYRKSTKDMSEILSFDTMIKTFPSLGEAHTVKERFDLLYLCNSRTEAEKYFQDWKKSLSADMSERFKPIVKTFKTHGKYIFNYFDTNKITNAYTESANKMIRWTNLVGRGYTFEVLRAKVVHSDGMKITKRPRFDRKFDMNSNQMATFIRDDDYGTSISKVNLMLEEEARLLGFSFDDEF